MMAQETIRIRIGILIVSDGKVLLIEHIKNGRSYWLIPGGGLEYGTVPFLVEMGVARNAIVFSENPRNTAEEAALMKSSGIEAVALVTSAWHMKRARMLFGRNGLRVVPSPTDFEMTFIAENPLEIGDFFPSHDGLSRNTLAIKEWVALAGYGLFSR